MFDTLRANRWLASEHTRAGLPIRTGAQRDQHQAAQNTDQAPNPMSLHHVHAISRNALFDQSGQRIL
jgi:hypothetical protein